MHELLITYAPYISGIMGAVLAFLTYRESKRKSQHDELHELCEEMKKQRDDALKQLDEMRKKND